MSTNSDPSRIRFWQDQKGSCPLCEQPILDPLDKRECNLDHRIPRSHGGGSSRSNLQLAHVACNSEKGCGCPVGDHFHNYAAMVQAVWRSQDFRCALCREPLAPSDILRRERAELINGSLSHVGCPGV